MARDLAGNQHEKKQRYGSGIQRGASRGKKLTRVALLQPVGEPNGRLGPRRAMTRAEKRQTIMDLKIQGYSHSQIGVALDLSPERIGEIIKDILTCLQAQTLDNAEQFRELELARLDKMLIELWPYRMGKAAETILKVLERRAKLLGLDAPVRAHVTGDGTLQEVGVRVDNLDLSKLDDEELKWLERIVDKAAPCLPAPTLPKIDYTAIT